MSPPQNERVQADVGFGRLPNLNLGRQYDTGLRFDRTRPTVRKDRYSKFKTLEMMDAPDMRTLGTDLKLSPKSNKMVEWIPDLFSNSTLRKRQ